MGIFEEIFARVIDDLPPIKIIDILDKASNSEFSSAGKEIAKGVGITETTAYLKEHIQEHLRSDK